MRTPLIPYIKIWYVRRSSWHELGRYPNKRLWYFRAWTGGNILGTKTAGIGIHGWQFLVGLKSPEELVINIRSLMRRGADT